MAITKIQRAYLCRWPEAAIKIKKLGLKGQGSVPVLKHVLAHTCGLLKLGLLTN